MGQPTYQKLKFFLFFNGAQPTYGLTLAHLWAIPSLLDLVMVAASVTLVMVAAKSTKIHSNLNLPEHRKITSSGSYFNNEEIH